MRVIARSSPQSRIDNILLRECISESLLQSQLLACLQNELLLRHEAEICEEIKENFISMLLLKEKKVEETEGHYFKIGVIIAN